MQGPRVAGQVKASLACTMGGISNSSIDLGHTNTNTHLQDSGIAVPMGEGRQRQASLRKLISRGWLPQPTQPWPLPSLGLPARQAKI